MKFWSSHYVFDHPWEEVTRAAWRKYPNKFNQNIFAIDVLDRNICKSTGILHTHRLISSNWGIPSWIATIIGTPNAMYANEWSQVNVKQKRMTLHTRNITFCKFVSVDEVLVYEPCEHDKTKTQLRQEANINVSGVPLSSYMENFLASSISHNSKKGHQAMNWVLETIAKELKELNEISRISLEEIKESAKKSTDELQIAAKKSLGFSTAATDKAKTPP